MTLPICAVGFPASTWLMNFGDSPVAFASSSRVNPCWSLAARMRCASAPIVSTDWDSDMTFSVLRI